MSDKLDLNSVFDTVGVFWDPTNPDKKFSAHTKSTASGLQLVTAAEMTEVNAETFFLESETGPGANGVLNGFTNKGRCTVLGLQNEVQAGLTDFHTLEAVSAHSFRVSACLVGIYLESSSTPVFRSASFRYRDLEGWLPSNVEFSFTEQGISIGYPNKVRAITDFSIPETRVRVTVQVLSNLKYKPGGQHSAQPEPLITIESCEPRSLEWFFDAAVRLENFFSLCVGTSVALRSVSLTSTENVNCWMLHHLKSKKQKPDRQAWIKCDPTQLAIAIATWLTTPDEFRAVENLIYGTIRHSSLFVETEFLSLAQAIESFHRVTDTATIIESSRFKTILEKLQALTNELCAETSMARRLIESMQHANEPSYRTRVESLLNRLNPDQVMRLVGDPIEFEQTLRQTRNYFTHPGVRKQGKVLTDTKGLFLFNLKLHALLRLLTLLRLGFPQDLVFEPTTSDIRTWR